MKRMWQTVLKVNKVLNKMASAPVEISVANRSDLDRLELRAHNNFKKF